MYRGFNLALRPIPDWLRLHRRVGETIHREHKQKVKSSLDEHTNQMGVIDGSTLQQDWFPEIGADVFISHSRKDQDIAFALAGWLGQEMKLKPFVDSAVWRYGDNLLRNLDDAYCYDEDTRTYRYEDRNKTTAHVHMMLATALTKMIDKSECLIFLNTPGSVTKKNATSTTHSPWLFAELEIARTIRRRCSRKTAKYADRNFSTQLQEGVRVSYDVSSQLAALSSLDADDLTNWKNWLFSLGDAQSALDGLYMLKPVSNNQ